MAHRFLSPAERPLSLSSQSLVLAEMMDCQASKIMVYALLQGSPSGYDAMSISPPHAQPTTFPDLSQPSSASAPGPFSFSQAAPNGPAQPTGGGPFSGLPGAQSSATPAASEAPSAQPNGPAFGSSAPGSSFNFPQSSGGLRGPFSAPSFGFGASGGFGMGFGGGAGFGASQPAAASAAAPGPGASSAPVFTWDARPQTSLPANGVPSASAAPAGEPATFSLHLIDVRESVGSP